MNDDDWKPISDVAAALTAIGDRVERSTLSRYISKWGIETRKKGRSTLVQFTIVRDHRRENMRLDTNANVVSEAVNHSGNNPRSSVELTGAQRKSLASAQREEMALARDMGTLIPAAEIEQAMRDAFAMLRAGFEKSIETTAADANLKYGFDERQVRQILKTFQAHGVDAFHREMLKSVPDEDQMTTGDHAWLSKKIGKTLQ